VGLSLYLCIVDVINEIQKIIDTLYTTEEPDSGEVIVGNGNEVIDMLCELTSLDFNVISNILESTTSIEEDEEDGSTYIVGRKKASQKIFELIGK
jgi:hypothetical protein